MPCSQNGKNNGEYTYTRMPFKVGVMGVKQAGIPTLYETPELKVGGYKKFGLPAAHL